MTTVRAALAHALREAARHDSSSKVAPAAVFWPDPDRVWESVIGQVQEAVPVLVLGNRAPDAASGPAVWIRTVLAGAGGPLPAHLAAHDADNPWVVYLAGWSRDDLSSVARVTDPLAPLVELQYRSEWWRQSNGQPWTPHTFLRSRDGLQIDLAHDAETRAALSEALRTLLDRDVDELRTGPRLDATRLRAMLMPDSVRDVLAWIDDPDATRARIGAGWRTFAAVCASEYGFNPDKDTRITAGGHLGRRQGPWAQVWIRFTEAPARYRQIPAVLDQAQPAGVLFDVADDPYPESWPSYNADQEAALRTSLSGLAKAQTLDVVRTRLAAMYEEHSARLSTVWAELGKAPLARAVLHLATLAKAATEPAPDGTSAIAEWYASTGHFIDDLALRAIAETRTAADRDAVITALGAVYDPWLDALATAFQTQARAEYTGATGLAVEPGTCVLFVDALRMDLGHRLARSAERAGLSVGLGHRLAAFPTVTPSGQPAVAPLTSALGAGPDFCAGDAQGRAVTGQVFRALLADAGVQSIAWGEIGDTAGIGWTQTNEIDELGHSQHHALAELVDGRLERIAEHIGVLLVAGWRRVIVVTDHGWLLPARPARKVDLRLHLTEGDATRKPRVARLKQGQDVDFPTLPWTWDADVNMVSAPGAAAFVSGTLYEHGGLSPQECVIPVITVSAGEPSAVEARIEALKWTAMRCRIDVAPSLPGLVVELRLAAGDATSTIAGPKPVVDGEAKVLVEDDAYEGRDAQAVLLDDTGSVVAQRSTRVGENP